MLARLFKKPTPPQVVANPTLTLNLAVTQYGTYQDPEDLCMSTVVDLFNIANVATHPLATSGPQIVLWLNKEKFNNIAINAESTDGTTGILSSNGRDFAVSQCAITSVLRKLCEAGSIEKENIYFQMRPRDGSYGVPGYIVLNPAKGEAASLPNPFIAENSYAYIAEDRLCVFLKKNTSEEKLAQLREELRGFLKEKNPVILAEKNVGVVSNMTLHL